MSYSLNIIGHVDRGSDAEQQKVGEAEIIEKAKAFVAELEGVSSAAGTFQHSGSVNLRETEAPAA